MAIVDWVRAGGNLNFVAGPGSTAGDGRMFSRRRYRRRIGLPRAFDVSAEDRQASGLGDRYATMTGHDLQPRPGALPISIFGEVTGQPGSFIPGPDSIVGYRKRVGLGNIVISPVDLGLVQFSDSEKRTVFWTSMIQEVMPDATARLATQNSQYTVALNQTYINAVSAAMDKTGNVPGLADLIFRTSRFS